MWSWVLACAGIAGMIFIGRKRWQAFLWMIGVECLWIVYSIQTGQHGFILGSIAYMTVYARNAKNWRRHDQRRTAAPSHWH
jgi:hypothetical protein